MVRHGMSFLPLRVLVPFSRRSDQTMQRYQSYVRARRSVIRNDLSHLITPPPLASGLE